MNNIEIFAEKSLDTCREYADIKKKIKKFEEKEKELKKKILGFFEENGIDKFDNELIKITRVKGSSSATVDLKKLEIVDSELFDELLAKFPKITKKKESIRIEVK